MTFEELKDKALSLPFAPGVYIMRDAGNKVIYVGKAKKLKNQGAFQNQGLKLRRRHNHVKVVDL